MGTRRRHQQEVVYMDDFKCPISLEIMSEPVILSSGHTFDRSSIQRWLDTGNRTCPITKQPLSPQPSLIPNHALRRLITHQIPPPDTLISTLTLPTTPILNKIDSIDRLTHLHPTLLSTYLTPLLNSIPSSHLTLLHKTLTLILNLSLDDHIKVGLVAEGAIPRIVTSLSSPLSPECRALSATILTSLSLLQVNKATIGSYPLAIPSLLSLMSGPTLRERRESATALFSLTSYPENRLRAVRFGAIPILINSASSGIHRAVEVLGLLAKCREGRDEMLGSEAFPGLFNVLVDILKGGRGRGVRYALSTLNSLCSHSEEACSEISKRGCLEICEGLMQDQNEKVRRNASSLIQFLEPRDGGA